MGLAWLLQGILLFFWNYDLIYLRLLAVLLKVEEIPVVKPSNFWK